MRDCTVRDCLPQHVTAQADILTGNHPPTDLDRSGKRHPIEGSIIEIIGPGLSRFRSGFSGHLKAPLN
jgi:hypothetical protein